MFQTITNAINELKTVSFVYDGIRRQVRIHVFGFNQAGELALRAYQDFNTKTNLKEGFKIFILSKVSGLELIEGSTFTRHSTYKRNDSYFKVIVAQV